MFPGTKGRNLMNAESTKFRENKKYFIRLFDEVSDNTEGLRPEDY